MNLEEWDVKVDPQRRGWFRTTRTEALSLGRALTVDEAESAIGRVGRNDGPALLFDLVSSDRLDLETLRAILPGVWSGAEYPAVSLGTRFWVHLFRRAAYPAPSGPLTLYRGAPPRYARGMSWTTRRSKAEWFAGRWGMNPGKASAHVYEATALPEACLADVDALVPGGRSEGEIVVDPSLLRRLRRVSAG